MAKTFRKRRFSHSRKQIRRGGSPGDLAYTGEPIPTVPNPFLAYTGKGGASSCGGISSPASVPVNTNAANPSLPNTGPVPTGDITFNNASPQLGGCGGTCGLTQTGGRAGVPYPDGLIGQPWTASPSDNNIGGNHNYYALNTYNNDISRQMMSNPIRGGKRRRNQKRTRRRKQRGGTMSNFLTQDLVNLGRQFQFGMGSAYNALSGYVAPVNPLPWKGQFAHK